MVSENNGRLRRDLVMRNKCPWEHMQQSYQSLCGTDVGLLSYDIPQRTSNIDTYLTKLPEKSKAFSKTIINRIPTARGSLKPRWIHPVERDPELSEATLHAPCSGTPHSIEEHPLAQAPSKGPRKAPPFAWVPCLLNVKVEGPN